MHYQKTQTGTWMFVAMAATTALLLFAQYSKPQATLWPAYVIIALAALLFSSLRIQIDDNNLYWHFGPGFWKKSLSLAEIRSVQCVRNKWYYGLGIRLLSTGWLYNVSGLDAVELCLKDGTTVTLGTDDPAGLSRAIELQLTAGNRP